MNESLQVENTCPNCGKKIKMSLKFCNYCGSDLGQHEINCPNCGKKIKMSLKFCNHCGTNLLQPKTDEIVITESFKSGRYFFFYCCFPPMAIAILLFGFIGATVLFIAFLALGAIYVGLYLFLEFIGFGRFKLKALAQPRTFSISNESIKFSIPKIPNFEIKWEDFVELKVKNWKSSVWTASVVAPPQAYMDLYFYKNDGTHRLCSINRKYDYNGKTVIRIISLIESYCEKRNKKFSYIKE